MEYKMALTDGQIKKLKTVKESPKNIQSL